jgi:hypothetical protein
MQHFLREQEHFAYLRNGHLAHVAEIDGMCEMLTKHLSMAEAMHYRLADANPNQLEQ